MSAVKAEFQGKKLLNDGFIAEAYVNAHGVDPQDDMTDLKIKSFLPKFYVACRRNADEAEGKTPLSTREYASELSIRDLGNPEFVDAMTKLLEENPKNAESGEGGNPNP